ncbi:hypothetical protein ACWCSH_29975 [Streptosporangium sp. NPDC001682]
MEATCVRLDLAAATYGPGVEVNGEDARKLGHDTARRDKPASVTPICPDLPSSTNLGDLKVVDAHGRHAIDRRWRRT